MSRIRTARLLLRRARTEDLAALHAVYTSPEAMRYWSREPHETVEETADLVSRLKAGPEPLSYFVIDRDGQAIGCCGVHERDEIGYILHPAQWGQGVMREALDAFIPYAWSQLGHTRLTAEADPRNTASAALLTSLGFAETRRAKKTMFLYGEWCDSVFYALTKG